MEFQILNAMKHIYKIVFGIVLISFLSCETEVDLALDTVEPRLVIDASIGFQQPCRVILSKTQDYWDQNSPTFIGGAKIILSDEEGNEEELVDLGDVYVSKMIGMIGKSYTLTIEVEEEVYQATDKIPTFVPIDSIYLYRLDMGAEVYYYPQIAFDDPKAEKNYYYQILSINGNAMQETNVEDDKYSDGLTMRTILYFDNEENNDEELKPKDVISVEMQTLGEGAYTFYNTISSPGGVANSNPVSNFSGDVLGMFKTYSSSFIDITLEDSDFH